MGWMGPGSIRGSDRSRKYPWVGWVLEVSVGWMGPGSIRGSDRSWKYPWVGWVLGKAGMRFS